MRHGFYPPSLSKTKVLIVGCLQACHCSHMGELCSLGEQCIGEQHKQIIERQKEALKELRTRLKNATGKQDDLCKLVTTIISALFVVPVFIFNSAFINL